MKIAEMLLRLGCAMVAWMVVFTHLIWLATLRVTGCSADADQLWRLLFGFAIFTVGFSFLLNTTRKISAVHDMLRWLAVPAVLLMPLGAAPIWDAFWRATIDGLPICSTAVHAPWHPWWAPVQLLVLGLVVFGAWRAYTKSVVTEP